MPTEDKYGRQLQEYFEHEATTEQPKAVGDALKVVSCSRARAYQWLQSGARDVIEVDRNSRGAALFAYVPGSKARLTVGPRGGGVMMIDSAPATGNRALVNLHGAAGGDMWLMMDPGQTLTVVSVRRTVEGGEVEVEVEGGARLLVTVSRPAG